MAAKFDFCIHFYIKYTVKILFLIVLLPCQIIKNEDTVQSRLYQHAVMANTRLYQLSKHYMKSTWLYQLLKKQPRLYQLLKNKKSLKRRPLQVLMSYFNGLWKMKSPKYCHVKKGAQKSPVEKLLSSQANNHFWLFYKKVHCNYVM